MATVNYRTWREIRQKTLAKPKLPRIPITLRDPFPRFRTAGGYAYGTGTYSYVNRYTTPPTTGSQSVTNVRSGNYSQMSDVVTPGYKDRIANGAIVNNPMKRWFDTRSPWNGALTWQTNNKKWDYTFSGTVQSWVFGDVSHLPSSKESACINAARVKANARINGADVMGLVSLAEMGKTVSMVAQAARDIAGMLRRIRQGKPPVSSSSVLGRNPGLTNQAAKFENQAANLWLQYSYGWIPTVTDLTGALIALYNLSIENKPRYTARGFGNDSEVLTSTTEFTTFSLTGKYQAKTTTTRELKARCAILYELTDIARDMNRFGILDLPGAVWELIPYSFVVDWFISIGEWIQAVTPKVGVNVLAESVTLEVIESTVREVIAYQGLGTGVDQVNADPGLIGTRDRFETDRKSRVVNLVMPLYPPVHLNLNVSQALSGISLLVQQAAGLGGATRAKYRI